MPQPFKQLTFHSAYDSYAEQCLDPIDYFKNCRLLEFMPLDKIIESNDATTGLLTDPAKKFLDSLNYLIAANHSRGFCISPSLLPGNIVVSCSTGECMLVAVKWHNLDEYLEACYSQAAKYFLWLLEEVEGPDIWDRLSDSVKDLILKMQGKPRNKFLMPFIEELIAFHPSIMCTDGLVHLITQADIVLRKQLKWCGDYHYKRACEDVLSGLPYLSSKQHWTSIAGKHKLLNFWFSHSKALRDRDARQRDMYRCLNLKRGKLKQKDREYYGKWLVSHHRDAVNHWHDDELMEIEEIKDILPLDVKHVVNVLSINYSRYLPELLEDVSLCGLRRYFSLDACFPRQRVISGVRAIGGLSSFLLKLGKWKRA